MKKTFLISTPPLVAFSNIACAKSTVGSSAAIITTIGTFTRNAAIANSNIHERIAQHVM